MSNYDIEVTERFGNTEAYKEYISKTAGCTEGNLQGIETALNAVFAKLAQCKAQGKTPDSFDAQATVRELKECITANCYTCTDDILKGLRAMYTADERFRKNIDKNGEGTAEFASEAIKIYTKDR